ncbi:MAG: hypothetical protein ACQKBY_07170, partial [Verrucomicrobiales bacterium]
NIEGTADAVDFAPMSTPTISYFTTRGFNLENGGSTDDRYIMDELRIGTTFADVVPVPEPSAALLTAFSALALCRRSRRD